LVSPGNNDSLWITNDRLYQEYDPMTFKFRWFSYIAVVLAVLGSGLSWAADPVPADPARPVLHVAYFIPTDRTPEPDRVARLDRVMTEVQRFYRDGMKQNGFGPMTFELDRDAKGALKVYDVRGQEPMRSYGRDDSEKVRREVKAALAKEGLNLDFETIVIFELLLEWQGDKATEIGPYVGGGNAHGGTARPGAAGLQGARRLLRRPVLDRPVQHPLHRRRDA
jgi:hypothetical protein